MKSFGSAFVIVLSLAHLSHSYTLHGSGSYYNGNANKRYNNQPQVPSASYYQQPQSYFYDDTPSSPVYQNYPRSPQPQPQQQQPQYLQYSSPSRGGSVLSDEYSSSNIDRYQPSSAYYYNPPRQADYQQPLYGIPTYRGDYQPKPYYFAQPSYSSSDDDQYETTNPLDYLHEEILEENERERSMNNAAFMQNLALYNKHVDSLKERQLQIQQMQNMFNLRAAANEAEDYNMIDAPNDWYDQTSIIVDPDTYESIRNNYNDQRMVDDGDDEMVKELRGLAKQNHRKSSSSSLPKFKNEYARQEADLDYRNDEEVEDDDAWTNWNKKRSIQPKKDYGIVVDKSSQGKAQQTKIKIATSTRKPAAKSAPTTTVAMSTSGKMLSIIGGQKEVVLPRPATPVRKPFSDSVMMAAAAAAGSQEKLSTKSTPPIYRTIKQIIDMEQNLSHVSTKFLIKNLTNWRIGWIGWGESFFEGFLSRRSGRVNLLQFQIDHY